MRIGFYIPSWPPGSAANGIATSLGRLAPPLREMGHEVFYVTPHSNGHVESDGITVIEAPIPSLVAKLRSKLHYRWNFESALFTHISNSIAQAVQRLVHDKGLDIFQMEDTQGWASTVIKKVSIPIVVKLHGPWFILRTLMQTELDKPENRHRIEREGEAIRNSAAVEAPSNSVLKLCEEYYGRLSCPTQVIPNPIPVRSETERWKLDACDRDLILFVGRFDYTKGADVLLRAYAKLATDRSKIRLLFVGPDFGLVSNSGYRMNFGEFVNQELPFALRNRIEYRGVLSQLEIEKLRARAYLTVVCSRYETFGNTVTEAMAAGCPIVATDAGGISEIIVNNRNGLVAPIADIDGLAAAIAKLLDDPALAARLGERAGYDCHARFEPRKIARRTVDFYSAIIEHHKQKAVNS